MEGRAALPDVPKGGVASLVSQELVERDPNPAEVIPALIEQGVLGATWADFSRLVGPEDFEQFEAIGRMLGKLHSATKFWIADWLTFGEGAMGDRYAQAAEALGLSERTMQDYHWVSQHVPRSRRRADLTFSHHRAVARRSIDPAQQEQLLELASRRDLSVRELDEEVKAIRATDKSRPEWSETVDDDVVRRSLDRRTLASAGNAVVTNARPRDGGWWVDNEPMARLRAAVGVE